MLKKYTIDGTKKLNIKKLPTNAKKEKLNREEIEVKYEENTKKMATLQDKLYAAGKEGIVVIFQALDAAGKDSSIKKVMTTMNPQGVHVHSFGVPSEEELRHDYMWRIHDHIPPRGEVAIFNRSYYEDVITVQVHSFHKNYDMPDRIKNEKNKDFFEKRYRQINDFERYLFENGYRVVKIFLNVSKDEQKARFLDRIERPEKNWKFNPSDLKDRAVFDKQLKTFEKVINATSTEESPWYVLPADQKWFTRYLISEIMVNVFEECQPHFPEVSEEMKLKIKEAHQILLAEDTEEKNNKEQ